MRKFFATQILLIFYVLAQNIFSQSVISEIERKFPYALWSLSISDDNNKEIISHNPDKLMIPASSLKIITSIYSLENLGPDFRFKTEILADRIKKGIANTLLIKGYGDMTLGSENFNSNIDSILNYVLEALNKNKIEKIENLCLDSSLLNDFQEPSWEWQDIGNYYAARVTSFSINDNSYKIYLETYNIGEKTRILKVEPDPGLEFENYVLTGEEGSGDNSYIYSSPYSSKAVIRGSIGKSSGPFIIKGSLSNPVEFFLKKLYSFLNSNGVKVKKRGVYYTPVKGNFKLLDTIYSPQLKEIIKIMNKKSFNFYAESLLRYSLIKKGKIGIEENRAELSSFLKNAGISNFNIVDGSGLSRKNAFSCDGFVKILNYARKKDYFNSFYDSLIKPGDDMAKGHIKDFGVDKKLNIRIKSGSLNGVRSYVGYINDENGKSYTFCFIMNNYTTSPSDIDALFENILSSTIGLK